MPTFFFRSSEHKAAPTLELPRVVTALLHLSIPVIMYNVLWNDLGREFLSKWTSADIEELAPERKQLYMMLDIYYSIRWATGMMIMQSEVSMPLGVFVAVKHFLWDECGYIVGSMGFWGGIWAASTGPLTIRDYAAAFLMVLAGILQHGSELQRWRFKRNPSNKGKIHTGGLFSLARGINHTGHMLRDVAHLLIVPHPFLVLFYPVADYDLACMVFPETQKHMRKKYGEQCEKYEKQTPWMFIPGVY